MSRCVNVAELPPDVQARVLEQIRFRDSAIKIPGCQRPNQAFGNVVSRR